jgi:hypothetical protein
MFQREAFRPQVNGGPELFKTYQVASPLGTHFRKVTCQEYGCAGYRNGFKTVVPAVSEQAAYIRAKSGRHFKESRDGDMAVFEFPAGQSCFRSGDHRVPLDRPAFFLVKDGDFRGNPYGTQPRVMRPEDWVDDFATHQQAIVDRKQRG